LAFAVFLAGGFLLASFVLPALSLLTRDGRRRQKRSDALLRFCFRAFIAMLEWLRVINLKLVRAHELARCRGVIVVSNHPTLIDVVLLSALIPRAQCIVKQQLWNSPFLGGLMRSAGYIPNNLEPDDLVATCRSALEDGRSLIIFPEGTRSQPGEPLHFQRGFAHLATLLNADIQLAVISCTPPTLMKGDKWWAIPVRRPTFAVTSAGMLFPSSWPSGTPRSRAVREITRRLERFYNEQTAH
jgi:1-acyl-sn-glycerol-3-phosphate acyltransferase